MSLAIKLKNFFGFDSKKDSWWLNSKGYEESWFEDKKIEGTLSLLGKSKCNLILKENTRLSIENDFEGIIIGRQNSTVRILSNFSGLVSCDLLICGPEANIKADIFCQEMIISQGLVFDAALNKGKLFSEEHQISLFEIKKLSREDLIIKYKLNSSLTK